jgi:acid stress-induced BolA-like protein IbaG/YrbA
MDQNIKDFIQKELNMEKVDINGQMDKYMKEIGIKIKYMEEEY